jgi:hypothetical protein
VIHLSAGWTPRRARANACPTPIYAALHNKDFTLLARKFLYVIAVLIMLTLAAAVGWNLCQDRILRWTFVPSIGFSPPPGEIDYARPENWVARPGLAHDPAGWTPAGFVARPDGPVATFFVPPTTYLGKDRWNGPLDDSAANARLDLFVSSQASAFNGLGPVWAPRYRQATAGAFLTDRAEAGLALDAAYRDVERAFDQFVAAIPPGQPILLAGHSQGSLHLLHLLARRIADKPVAKRIIAVYLVGWPVSLTADLPKLGLPGPFARRQAGCILSWQSFAEPADPAMIRALYDRSTGLTGLARKGTAMLCVNPLTGAPDSAAPAAANRGALVPKAGLGGADLVAGLVPARCDSTGLLLIGGEPTGYGAYVLPGHNYHVFDYALFWANIRADAEARAAAFSKR